MNIFPALVYEGVKDKTSVYIYFWSELRLLGRRTLHYVALGLIKLKHIRIALTLITLMYRQIE